MFAPVIGAAYTMTTKREAHWSEQTKAENTEKGMYVGLKQPRGDEERYVTPARAAELDSNLHIWRLYSLHLGKNLDFCSAFEIRTLARIVYQDKWFVSVITVEQQSGLTFFPECTSREY